MKNLIVKILLVAAIFSYGNVTFGQEKAGQEKQGPKMTPEQRADKRTEDLKGKLNLTPEQMPKVKEIILKHENQKQQMMQAAGEDKDQRRAAIEKDRTYFESDMSKVLTPDQMAKLRTMDEHKANKAAPAPAGK